ncbi:MAG: glycoside hydrolase family 140 protein [Lachnospiraceae bacterium]|nr:glycoside hydrolase family 140 protein [Lachnospiraceae bacterium]
MEKKFWEYGVLQVAENKRYLKNGERPFFWMGDTAWLLFQKCSLAEARVYLENRKAKQFNVIQATLVHMLKGDEVVRADFDSEDYWKHCDAIISIAEELGLYMALLPSWGSLVKEKVINEENVEKYADFLAKRYGNRPNVIWLLGGDIRGTDGIELYKKLGMLMKGKTTNQLIGYHPFGRTSSSLWFHDEEWLDFNMFQSGHRRYDQVSLGEWDDNNGKEGWFGEDNWKYVNRDHSYATMKPTVDGEPSYEWIPQGLHDPKEPFWQAADVRRYAYWAVFQGAMGHTYGNNAIMQFYNTPEEPGSYGVKEVWQDALHHEGSCQMSHLVSLMESVDFQSGEPAEELLVGGQKEKYARVSVFAGADYIFAYAYLGEEFVLDLSRYAGKKLTAAWFDPASGVYSPFGEIAAEKQSFKPIQKYSNGNDWVLRIDIG